MAHIKAQSLPATPMLMLVLNNSSTNFTVEGSATQQDIEIYTNNIDRFNKDIGISQNNDVTALAVIIRKNPKYNIIQNHGVIRGQCIGDHQKVTQHFYGNVMRSEVTSDISVIIKVPESIDVSVYDGVNVSIKGVKGDIEQ